MKLARSLSGALSDHAGAECTDRPQGPYRGGLQHLGERRITVNTVSPGPTATEEFLRLTEGNPEFVQQELAKSALRRLGTPEDIANIVAFLASEDSGWITGQLIDATGGSLLG